ncbi:ETX/MTX2 family pore-forming toxin [Enterococcus faecium]|nr:ETX/MTX2 family pore-forming toxin [Enterococcus faecium]
MLLSRRKKMMLAIFVTTGILCQPLMNATEIFADTYVSSGEVDNSNNQYRNNLGLENVTEQVTNELRSLSYNLSHNMYLHNEISSKDIIDDKGYQTPGKLKVDTPSIKLNNDMVLTNGDTLAAHESVLQNNSKTDQIMSTASFNYSQTDKVTTSTTNSAGTGITTSAEMKFPFASGSVSMNVKYDFSNTNAVESSTTKQWNVPSQNIKVPAGHKYKVNWVMNTGVATGTVNLISNVCANIPFKLYNGYIYAHGIGAAISNQDQLVAAMPDTQYKWSERKNWEIVGPYQALRNWGNAQYKAEFGTELVMEITDVTNEHSQVIVQKTPMNLAPIIVK